MICGFFAGVYAKTLLRKVGVSFVAAFFATIFYGQADNYFHGGIAALSFFVLFYGSTWTAIGLAKLVELGEEEEFKERVIELKKMSEIEVVQEIDNFLNCEIGINHQWINKYWHSLEDHKKVEWVKRNRDSLNEQLLTIENTAELISLMQQIERSKQQVAS